MSRPAVLIAMAGIAIGLAVMIIAVAVVIGFKSEVRNKVIGFGSHIQITNLDAVSSYETHPIVVGDSMMTALADYPEISHVQRFSTKPGMIKTDDAFQGMVLKGVGPEFDPHFIKEYLVEGEIPVFSDSVSSNQVLISKALATKMKLKLGDKIYTYYIQDDIRARRLTIAGIYQTNFSEYDNLFLLTDLNLVNRLNGWQPEQVTGVELQVKDYDKLEDITYEIATDIDNRMDKLGGVYYVRNIEQLNPQIFAWLDLLDLNVCTDSSPDGFTATQNGSGRKNGTRSRAEMSITSGSNRKSLCRSKRAKRCSTAPIIRRNGASLRQQKSRRAASISWRERTPAMNGWKHTTI